MNQRILFVSAGDKSKASSRVRVYWLKEELVKSGFHCKIIQGTDMTGLLSILLYSPFFDVIIFQKCYSKYHIYINSFLKKIKKLTFLDIDDHPSFDNNQTVISFFNRMCSSVDGVFCGSRKLFQFVSHSNAKPYLLPTSIKQSAYSVSKVNNPKITLGWIGNGKYYENDLIEILFNVLLKISSEFNLALILVGTKDCFRLKDKFKEIENLEILYVDSLNWSNTQEVSSILNKIDIGLYPLKANKFNNYKCGFKALEYFVFEIPVVASNLKMLENIVIHNVNGFLATDSNQWYEALKKLIEDDNLRRNMGRKGKNKTEVEYSVETSKNNILSILQNIFKE